MPHRDLPFIIFSLKIQNNSDFPRAYHESFFSLKSQNNVDPLRAYHQSFFTTKSQRHMDLPSLSDFPALTVNKLDGIIKI